MPSDKAIDAHGLAAVIDALIDSYRDHGNINHLDGTNVPSRSEVARVQDDLVSLLFPGYFVQDQVDELTCRYFVGERCARALRGLERVLGRAFAVGQCPGSAPCGSPHELALQFIQQLPAIRAVLDSDVQAAIAGDPAARSAPEVIMSYPGIEAIAVYRMAHALHMLDVPLIPRMMTELVHSRTGIDIHPGARIGERFFIDHGTGVVIGETTRIGDRVKLYQGVTLGALSVTGSVPDQTQRHPTIEDDVTIYAGATILGGDTVIGRGSVIGGNVWLTRSVPEQTTVILDKPSLRFLNNVTT